jgi:large subunit ribosomal protein L32
MTAVHKLRRCIDEGIPMAVPKKKTSKQKRNTRRSHHALTPLNFSTCTNCGSPHLPHCVCESCGYYKGRTLPQRYLKANLSLPT